MDHKLYEDKCKAAERDKTELERKIQLIKEIKGLEKANEDMRSNTCNVKLDKAQTSGYGLLSEMSLTQVNYLFMNKNNDNINTSDISHSSNSH